MTDKTPTERLHWHMYESCEGIREHAERIVALEELVEDMKAHICRTHRDEPCAVACGAYDEMLGVCVYEKRMVALGLEY